MQKQVEIIKQSLQIAIAERVDDRRIFLQSSALLEQSNDQRYHECGGQGL
jgi:hypothetical protein